MRCEVEKQLSATEYGKEQRSENIAKRWRDEYGNVDLVKRRRQCDENWFDVGSVNERDLEFEDVRKRHRGANVARLVVGMWIS